MAIVKCKPTSAGRRHVVKIVNPELHKGKPYAPLLDTKSKTGGRNKLWSYYYSPHWWRVTNNTTV